MQSASYKVIINIIGVFVFLSITLTSRKAEAVEGASGFYLLGSKGSPADNYF